MAAPGLAGASQFTTALLVVVAPKVGAAGFAGGATSVTVTVTVRAGVDSTRPVPPALAVTVKVQVLELLPVPHPGLSKSGAVSKPMTPAPEMENRSWSVPPSA